MIKGFGIKNVTRHLLHYLASKLFSAQYVIILVVCWRSAIKLGWKFSIVYYVWVRDGLVVVREQPKLQSSYSHIRKTVSEQKSSAARKSSRSVANLVNNVVREPSSLDNNEMTKQNYSANMTSYSSTLNLKVTSLSPKRCQTNCCVYVPWIKLVIAKYLKRTRIEGKAVGHTLGKHEGRSFQIKVLHSRTGRHACAIFHSEAVLCLKLRLTPTSTCSKFL